MCFYGFAVRLSRSVTQTHGNGLQPFSTQLQILYLFFVSEIFGSGALTRGTASLIVERDPHS